MSRKNATAKRKSRERLQTPPEYSGIEHDKIQNICDSVSRKTKIKHAIDHLMPLARNGKHYQGNFQVIPAIENGEKLASHPIDFYGEEEYLRRKNNCENGIYYEIDYTYGYKRRKAERLTTCSVHDYKPPCEVKHAGERKRDREKKMKVNKFQQSFKKPRRKKAEPQPAIHEQDMLDKIDAMQAILTKVSQENDKSNESITVIITKV
jgi:hypothetical protein